MKKHLLKLFIVCGLIALSADLRAFTAVQSGPWSDANTWGGVGPGSTVTNQDIIIPSGITVDLDIDVTFNGTLNSFWVTGLINGSMTNEIRLEAGTITGTGTIYARKLTLAGPTAFYSFTGTLHIEVLRNEGTIANLTSMVVVHDTLDLEAGAITLGGGADLQLLLNSNVRVNNGVLVNSGGIFTTGYLYDVWYFGGTKTSGEELNSGFVRDIHLVLNNNTMKVSFGTNVSVMGILYMITGHIDFNGKQLTLYGDLAANPGSVFESSGTSVLVVTGWGGTFSSGLKFTAGSSLDKLTIDRNYVVDLESSLMITGNLTLIEGHLTVDSASTISMGSGSVIKRIQGDLTVNGTFDGTQQYDVQYLGDSLITGIELSGPGFNSLLINLWNTYYRVFLTQDLVIPGDFVLSRGQLYLDTNRVEFQGTFTQDSAAEIWGSLDAELVMSMAVTSNDTLYMRPQAYPLKQITIDLPPGNMLTLGANLFTKKVIFLSGKLNVGNSFLKVGGTTPTIIGANDTNYVVITSGGSLVMYVWTNYPYLVFPIGTPTEYSPISIRQTGSSLYNGYFITRVRDGVWTNGGTGTDVSTSQSVVNKSWYIQADSGTLFNMDIVCGWQTTSEVNGFDRQNCFIKNYYNNAWDSYPSSAAVPGSSNTYTVERLGLSNTGYFVVVDNNSPLNVEETTPEGFALYPNPANDQLNIQVNNPDNSVFRYELFDATGRLIMVEQNGNSKNNFDLSSYEGGSYILHITNLTTGEVITRKVIKS